MWRHPDCEASALPRACESSGSPLELYRTWFLCQAWN